MRTVKYKLLFCIVFLFIISTSFSQGKSNFIRIDKKNTGTNIIEDDLGYLWVLGRNGLNKYDGYDFNLITNQTIFKNDLTRDRGLQLRKDSDGNLWLSSIGGNLIRIDKDQNITSFKNQTKAERISAISLINNSLWFGASNGILFNLNTNSQKITKVIQLPKLDSGLQNILSIVGYDSSIVWISSSSGKVYSYSLETNTLTELINGNIDKIQGVRLIIDKEDNLWIATELEGLFKYNTISKKFYSYFNINKSSTKTLKHPMFTSIICDHSGKIWAGTDGDGLYKINPSNGNITNFKNNFKNSFSISNNTIINLFEDRNRNIWVINKNAEISVLPNNNNSIKYFSGFEDNTPTKILSILKSKTDKSLWLGTDGNGLNRVLPNNSTIHYDNTKKGKLFFEGKYIQSLLEDDRGNVWIATYQSGLWVFNLKTKTFTKIETFDLEGNHSLDIRYLFKDSKNRIWVSTGVSLNLYSSNQKKITAFNYKSKGLFGRSAFGISEDENGTIWVGLIDGGLFKFNENKNDLSESYFTNKKYYTKKPNDATNYNIRSIIPDENGSLYILCSSGIIIRYELESEEAQVLSNKKVLNNIIARSVLLEDPNNLWLSSTTGIHHYQIDSETLKSYNLTDGLQNNNFISRSSFKDSFGAFYFGSYFGVNSFLPKEIEKNESLAKLYINQIEILNKPAKSLIKDQLITRIEDIKEIKLNSNQSSFSFQFSAIDNILNSNYLYAYRLKGFDEKWIIPRQGRIATYTNIPAGNYTFEVKASSKNGVWDIKPKTIDIFIKTPWWFSTIAFICYFIIILLIGYGIVIWLQLKKKLANKVWENQKAKELYGLKMNFFTKMSHEIQTPLTLILGPIEDMLNRATSNGNQLLKQRLTIISNNAKRLSRIATELMTVRNKELGRLRVYASQNEIIDHLKSISISFSEQARYKNIDFSQVYSHQKIKFWYDKDKIEHVFYNLLSNAFKFTPVEGSIKLIVNFNEEKESLKISVHDSGPGIPKEELDAIFKLFYQTNLGLNTRGAGIGLALTQELITLHNGSVSVDSSPSNGTNFTVILSTNETNINENQKIKLESNAPLTTSDVQNYNSLIKGFGDNKSITLNKKNTLLIVEDNIEMQMFLRDTLNKVYNLIIAENAKKGILLAEKNNPDMIISDIMMPGMDGIEMCKILQKKKSTSHIPIIFLTAKNNSDGKISGLKAGAVEYLNKPFNFYELLFKINNIISTKEKLISKYKTDLICSPNEITAPSKDDIFMENLVRELNAQIENPDFRLEKLSESLNMSYSVIYRKCQNITGKTLVDFVRSLKLKKAALIIAQQEYNISEASFMVGYKDAKYFTKCFKEEFGMPPITFKKEAKKIGLSELTKKYKIQL